MNTVHPSQHPLVTLLAEALLLTFWLAEGLRLRLRFEWSLCGRLGLVPYRRPLSESLSDRGRPPLPAVAGHSSPLLPAAGGPGPSLSHP